MTTTAPVTTHAWEWSATGTTWRVLHTGGVTAALAAAISQAVEQDEARWSRFRRDSEVSRLNRAGGQPVPLSPETLDLLEASIDWTRRTDGVFQPLIGDMLVAWGYRRSLLESTPYAHRRPGPAATRRPHRPEPSSWHRPDSTRFATRPRWHRQELDRSASGSPGGPPL